MAAAAAAFFKKVEGIPWVNMELLPYTTMSPNFAASPTMVGIFEGRGPTESEQDEFYEVVS